MLKVYRNTKVRRPNESASVVMLLTPGLQVYIPSESAYPNVFAVEGPDEMIYLVASSHKERASWMNAIQGLEHFKKEKLKPKAQFFIVKADDSGDMLLLGCSGCDCILAVDREEIQLANLRSKKFIVRWPLHCVRRYMCEAYEFKIYTGPGAPRGEGEYTFHSTQAEHIYSILAAFIDLKAEEQLRQESTPDSLDNRSPAPLPLPAAAISDPPPQTDGDQLEGSMMYHDITSDLVPSSAHTSTSGGGGEYSRTRHDLGPQFNQVDEGGDVAVADGVYSTLQHMDKDRNITWYNASIASNPQYAMAMQPAPRTGAGRDCSVAEFPKTDTTATAQEPQHSPDPPAPICMNPTCQSLQGNIEEVPKPHTPEIPTKGNKVCACMCVRVRACMCAYMCVCICVLCIRCEGLGR